MSIHFSGLYGKWNKRECKWRARYRLFSLKWIVRQNLECKMFIRGRYLWKERGRITVMKGTLPVMQAYGKFWFWAVLMCCLLGSISGGRLYPYMRWLSTEETETRGLAVGGSLIWPCFLYLSSKVLCLKGGLMTHFPDYDIYETQLANSHNFIWGTGYTLTKFLIISWIQLWHSSIISWTFKIVF